MLSSLFKLKLNKKKTQIDLFLQSEIRFFNWDTDKPDATSEEKKYMIADKSTGKWRDIKNDKQVEVICQKTRKCTGDQTYNSTLEGEFLESGWKIKEVLKV